MDYDPSVLISFDPKLFLGAENEGRKISSDKSGQDMVEKLMPFVRKLTGKESVAPTGSGDNFIGTFLKKLKEKK